MRMVLAYLGGAVVGAVILSRLIDIDSPAAILFTIVVVVGTGVALAGRDGKGRTSAPLSEVLGRLQATDDCARLVASEQAALTRSAAVTGRAIAEQGTAVTDRLRSEGANPALQHQVTALAETGLAALTALNQEASSALGLIAGLHRPQVQPWNQLWERLLRWLDIEIVYDRSRRDEKGTNDDPRTA